MFLTLLQAAQQAQQAADKAPAVHHSVWNVFYWPIPYSPFSEYLVVLFVLWIIAHRDHEQRKDFSAEAQKILDEKYRKGEINLKTFEKYRQELSLRLKKE